MMPANRGFAALTSDTARLSASPRKRAFSGGSSASAATPSVTTLVSASAPSRRGRSPKPMRLAGAVGSSALGKAVARAAHGEDQPGCLGRKLKLLAQMADVNVDRPWIAVGRVAPNRSQELLAIEEASGLGHQAGQQLEL